MEDKKLRTRLRRINAAREAAAARLARNELLLTEEAGFAEAEGLERTYHFRQADLAAAVDVSSASKVRPCLAHANSKE
jgi:U3 small nucleolar RNA-associated protein 7